MWKAYLILSMACAMCVGCDRTPDGPDDAHRPVAGSSVSSGAGCDADVVETVLPGQSGASVVALCTSCDRGCDNKGPACAEYGDSCDFFGEPGVCGACCDGDRGVLRCHPVADEPPQECPLPNAGSAPTQCATADDCFWSDCASSSCIDGTCAHARRADGSVCFVPVELGTIGTCQSCLCTIET